MTDSLHPSPAAPAPRHRITVVVMTRNRSRDLQATLPRHEHPVVVVDNASTDDTVQVVEDARASGQPVSLVRLATNHGSVARTIGARHVTTPYLAFADDDSWWEPGSLDSAAEALDAHPGVALVSARILVGDSGRLDPLSAEMGRAPWGRANGLPGPHILGFAACGVALRRDAFLGVGGFDEVVFFAGEEERVAYDLTGAGWALVYLPELVVRHHPSPSRSDAGERTRLITRNALLTAWQRRPLGVAVRHTVRALRAGGPRRAGALAVVPRWHRAIARRRRNPPLVERMLADAA